MDVFGELEHLDAAHRDLDGTAQHVEQRDAELAGETFVDHLQRGHAPTHDPVLTGEVVALDLVLADAFVGLGLDVAAAHTVQQRIDFFL